MRSTLEIGELIGKRSRRLAPISEYRDRHQGRRAFLIGSGPGVRLEHLEALAGEVTFCFNRFHLAYQGIHFRPTYTVVADAQMLEHFGGEIAEKSSGTVVLAAPCRPRHIDSDFLWVRLRNREPFRFSEKAHRFVVSGGSVVVAALQIAYYMGIRDVGLYGMDHRFKFERLPGGHRGGRPWYRPETERINRAMRACREFFEANGGSLERISKTLRDSDSRAVIPLTGILGMGMGQPDRRSASVS